MDDVRGVEQPGSTAGAAAHAAPVPRFAEALAPFARRIAAGDEVSDVLHELTAQVGQVLALGGTCVSLVREDGLHFATCASERHAALERLQESGPLAEAEGPCAEAVRSGREVLVPRLADVADRWPRYARVGAELGVCSVAALPLRTDVVVGTLELYDDVPREWTAGELTIARVFADLAAGHLRGASALEQQRRVSDQLQSALHSRVVIEQAKGIVAAQRGVTVDAAFQILRKHANDHGATLRAVAEAVVNLGLQV